MKHSISAQPDTLQQITRIKDALMAAETVEQVNAIAKLNGDFIADLAESPVYYVHALHVRNLAQYMRMRLREGWGPLRSGGAA